MLSGSVGSPTLTSLRGSKGGGRNEVEEMEREGERKETKEEKR